mmetsp:Transcript_57374/g.178090  ORF Transcript_57374/g.178090 Transcript_57374/m.178090 type:complete len:204 (-) Transcript_57374:214-825(-)
MLDNQLSDLQLLQKNTFIHTPAPDLALFTRRSKSAPPSSISTSEDHNNSEGSTVFQHLDGLLQPRVDRTEEEPDANECDSDSDQGDQLNTERKTARRAPKKKRERLARFLNWAEQKLTDNKSMSVPEITLPAFIEADPRAKEKALRRLENFVQHRDQGGAAPLSSDQPRERGPPQPAAKRSPAPAASSSSRRPVAPGPLRMSL